MICTCCGEEFTPTPLDAELERQLLDPCCPDCRGGAYYVDVRLDERYRDTLRWGE